MFVLLQLIGLEILPLPSLHPILQIVAITLSCTGLALCITARHTLGNNWTNAKDYEQANNHRLVTIGIYRYIRHPIYVGLIIMLTGAEMLAQSYLIVLLPLVYLWTYRQAKKEENMLLERFRGQFTAYKAKTKIFVPYII